MRLLDLFCCQGGSAMGYYRAGFTEIVGVDIKPQPRYPFTFIKDDALEYLKRHWQEFDAFHASPPCQFGSEATPLHHRVNLPNYIPSTRDALLLTGKPFIIENVENVRKHLREPVMLCGSMFNLRCFRHRYFETNGFQVGLTPKCNHNFEPLHVTKAGSNSRRIGRGATVKNAMSAYGIDWMSKDGLVEAIPPAYTEFLGRHLIAVLTNTVSASPILRDSADTKLLSDLKVGVSFGGNR
jgi:DNA (cytosine-5)-methyltransferase 1